MARSDYDIINLSLEHELNEWLAERGYAGLVDNRNWICPYISRHLLSLNPLQARCRRYSRGER